MRSNRPGRYLLTCAAAVVAVGPATAPAAARAAHVLPGDWDGDGSLDVVTLQTSESDTDLALALHLANENTWPPSFAAPQTLRINSAGPLTGVSLADWEGDGDSDVLACHGEELWLWERAGPPTDATETRAGRAVCELTPSDFRAELTGFAPAAPFLCRGVQVVDWHGDGGRDLLVTLATDGGDVALLELLEQTCDGSYASAVGVRDDRGMPIVMTGPAVGPAAYMDWDHDGDFDLLFFDRTARPPDAGTGAGWLMFAENDGTRDRPVFVRPFAVLPVDGPPVPFDLNDDGRLDLVSGGAWFENVNPRSSTRLPRESPLTPGGSRSPHPWTLPRLEPRGPLPLP
jgi:hypothetical protein